jgi:transcription initiation factor TFIIIB Brf1 subunit/transcription initiation factor TFIIB
MLDYLNRLKKLEILSKKQQNNNITNNNNTITNIKVNKYSCIYCKKENSLIYDSENYKYICKECGSIQPNSIIYKDETKVDNDILPSVYNYRNINTAFLNSTKNKTLINIYKWNSYTFAEMEMNKLLTKIHDYCQKLNIKKNIEDNVIIFYKLIIQNKTNSEIKNQNLRRVTFRGKNKISMIGSCIFYACKKNNFIKSLKEIALCLKIPTKLLNKSCNEFLKIMNNINYNYDFNNATSYNYLNSYALKLKLTDYQYNQISIILKKIEKTELFKLKVSHIKAFISILLFIIISKKNLKSNKTLNKQDLDIKYVTKILNISRSSVTMILSEISDYNIIKLKNDKYTLSININHINKKIIITDKEKQIINDINIEDYPNYLYLDKIKTCFQN